jgi:hypothetical protein
MSVAIPLAEAVDVDVPSPSLLPVCSELLPGLLAVLEISSVVFDIENIVRLAPVLKALVLCTLTALSPTIAAAAAYFKSVLPAVGVLMVPTMPASQCLACAK